MRKHLLLTGCLALFAFTQSFALDKVNGVYQIGTAQDLVDFSAVVAGGEGDANAVLTADINMSGVTDFLPIGMSETNTIVNYTGTFDGQCHFIRNLSIDKADVENVGLFSSVADGAYIKNVVLDENSSVHGSAYVGGIAGQAANADGTITFENVGNEAVVLAENQNAAGLLGVCMGGKATIKLIRCFNTGNVTGNRESASFCGWFGNNCLVQDCYSFCDVEGQDGSNSVYRNWANIVGTLYDKQGLQGTAFDEEALSSGEFAYTLNDGKTTDGVWRQNLTGDNVDPCPVPFSNHSVVYANGALNCDGSVKVGADVTYGNTDESVRDPHQFVDGVCSVCGQADPTYLTANADGFYELSTPEQLNWYAATVNHGDYKAKAKLTADIDFTAYPTVMIGGKNTYTAYQGVFDGQGHTITVSTTSEEQYSGLFRYMVGNEAHTEGVIRNLRLEGDMTVGNVSGVLVSSVYDGLIENVLSDVNVNSEYQGDATVGGLVGVINGATTIRNCAFVGTMDVPNGIGNGGLVGWCANNTGKETIENSYVAATFSVSEGNYFNRNRMATVNTYYVRGENTLESVDPDADGNSTEVEESDLTSGRLAYWLNNNVSGGDAWHQTLGKDAFPVPFATSEKVYATGNVDCHGRETENTKFSNTQGELVQATHQFNENGECTICGDRRISTGAQLLALQNDQADGLVPEGVNVELTDDIDMDGITGYTGIGTMYHRFIGTFNGNGHRIKNMLIEGEHTVGLFSIVGGPTTIKNVVVDSSCEIYTSGYDESVNTGDGEKYDISTAAGGIVGAYRDYGYRLIIENVGNEASVSNDQLNAAGILGVQTQDTGFSGNVQMKNVYNTGNISGAKECATICGWLTNSSSVENAYNTGELLSGIDGTNTFVRHNTVIPLTNCYDLEGVGKQLKTTVTEEQVKNGELCYLLNGMKDNGTNFYQTLGDGGDDHPVLDATHKTVYKDGDTYKNPDATGIKNIDAQKNAAAVGIYTIGGAKVSKMQKGINIVKRADGTVQKVLVK